ncbi:hypothetical protein [Anaerocellum danielii]|uniref:Uncharacterized protein n=1 Tax=Anaerocellum danielii TaxID=1387557 RepID=A0ABZ0U0K1_9FIRM|nr:hypothetical protein [Caldicellulosiruptor danielii]WPX08143.1 hypothetical protein SOJ16_002008 [Caldicellulosiruptor danielii]
MADGIYLRALINPKYCFDIPTLKRALYDGEKAFEQELSNLSSAPELSDSELLSLNINDYTILHTSEYYYIVEKPRPFQQTAVYKVKKSVVTQLVKDKWVDGQKFINAPVVTEQSINTLAKKAKEKLKFELMRNYALSCLIILTISFAIAYRIIGFLDLEAEGERNCFLPDESTSKAPSA